jgi:hypothetical protein
MTPLGSNGTNHLKDIDVEATFSDCLSMTGEPGTTNEGQRLTLGSELHRFQLCFGKFEIELN